MKHSLTLLVLVQIFGIYSGQRVAPGVPPQQYQHVPQHQVHQQQQHMPQQHHQQVPMQQQQMHQAPVHQQPPPPPQQQMHNPNMQQQMHQVPVQQQGHHAHHAPAPGQILNAANIAHEKDHIAEHMEVPMDTSKMSEQELQFHYFKMHDADNNNKLDGCELIKSLIHWHEQGGKEKSHSNHVDEKIFKDDELIALIDPILGMDDGNHDGYIDYPEFVRAQQKAAAASPKS